MGRALICEIARYDGDWLISEEFRILRGQVGLRGAS